MGFCTEEVAEHTIGFILNLVRSINFYDKSVREGKWNPLIAPKTHRLPGKIIGLVFFGEIPKKMLPTLFALRLNVEVYAPTKSEQYLKEYGCKKVETLEELLESSDFVSLHCPLIEGVTYHLIGKKELERMKSSAYLINTARGSVVDEKALVDALKNGKIKGAAVDVIEDEAGEKSELFSMENVIVTPHAAFISEDSFYEGRRRCLEQLVIRLSKNERPINLVNKNINIFEKVVQNE